MQLAIMGDPVDIIYRISSPSFTGKPYEQFAAFQLQNTLYEYTIYERYDQLLATSDIPQPTVAIIYTT